LGQSFQVLNENYTKTELKSKVKVMALNKLPYSRKLNQAQTRKGINFPPLEGKVGKCSVCKSLQECPKAFVCNFLSLIRSRQQFVKHSHLTPTAHRPLAQMSTLDTNSQTGTGRNSAPAPLKNLLHFQVFFRFCYPEIAETCGRRAKSLKCAKINY